MKVNVRFRFNKQTGEVEEFIVDDVDSRLSQAEHNRQHDRLATEVGRIVERYPHIDEVLPGTDVVTQTETDNETEQEALQTPQKAPAERQSR